MTDQTTTDLNLEAIKLGLSPNEALQAMQDAAAQLLTRLAPPRLKWGKDNSPDENPAAFAWRAYQVEARAGTLHRKLIAQEDKALALKLPNWLRKHPMPEGIDIPTHSEWITRQLAKMGNAPQAKRTDEGRLYEALLTRRLREKRALTRT